MKSRDGRSQREERWVEERKKKSQKKKEKKIQVCEMLGNSRNAMFVQWFVGRAGRKAGSLKAAGAEPFGHMRNEKLYAVAARSTCPSQNEQNTPCPDPFWKFGCLRIARRCGAKHMSKSKCAKQTMSDSCLKIARRCGAKHMSKSKCAKHTRLGPFFEDQMPKQKVT